MPEVAPALPSPDDPELPDKLKALRHYGMLAKQEIEREDEINAAFKKGDFRFAGEVIKHAQRRVSAA